jgi:predicted ATPase
LRQYEECIRLLQAEMGVPPERKTVELAERIQRDDLPRFAPAPSTLRIPQPTTPFVGRDAELVELDRLLGDPAVRLVTILAVGGMGKTRLAIETAARQTPNFAHGICFVELAPLQFGTAILPTLADTLGLTFREDLSQTQQILDFLREKTLLLVFDNFEHLVESADLVSDLLQAAPQIKVLTTSRVPLGLQGEVRFHLGGLDVPGPDPTEDALNAAAVRLFAQGARRAQPGFKLEGGDLQDVVRIVRLVQGMPLGILLAAGWVEMMAPQEIAGEIARSLDFLATELRDIPERQRSMRAVFAQTWAMLGEREQQAFACLSTFRGGFSRLAACPGGAGPVDRPALLLAAGANRRPGAAVCAARPGLAWRRAVCAG